MLHSSNPLGLPAILLLATACALFGEDASADLRLRDLDGVQRSLREFRGRIVVLNFWATWCIPCREEMPLLMDIQRRYERRGVVVVGASADDESTEPQIKPFLEKLGIRFPVWKGASTEDMQALGLGAALPATAILDRDGRIAFRILGMLTRRDLVRRLDYLLGARTGEPPEELLDLISPATEEHHDHEHGKEEGHAHGSVGLEGASTVPS